MINFIKACWHFISRIIVWCINLILKPFGKKLTGQQEASLLQFCKFAIVGVSNTLVSMFINFAVLFTCNSLGLLQAYDAKVYVANCTAFFLSVIWSYIWNSRFVFAEDENAVKRVWWKTLLKTYVAYAFTGLGLANFFSWLFVTVLGINEYLAVLINLVVAVPINYVMNKFWAYGQKKKDNCDNADN